MTSPLSDPSPPLGIGIVVMLLLLAWGMGSVASTQRGAVARVVATHVGVTTCVLAVLSVFVGRSVSSPAANPFIGRVIQIFVSVVMVGLLGIIALKRIGDLRDEAAARGEPSAGYRDPANGAPAAAPSPTTVRTRQTSGALVVLAFFGFIAALFVFLWLVLARAT
jgi:hypothetical protein